MSIRLEPFDVGCINDEYLSWLNNKELLKYSRQVRLTHSKQSCLDYLKSFENSHNIFWSVRNSENEQIGTMTAFVDKASLVADIGIMIGRSGKGFGTKAWKEAIRVLFEEKGMRKVTAGTLSVHKNMIAIFENAGMKREAFLHQQELLNGVVYDVVKYGLLRDEWQQRL